MNMSKPEIIAFYLPQYFPTKENNEWFGEGFTEWTNVGKATPLFRGHYQPKVPADLGYYDLRLTDVRRKQAELACEAGVSAFCYYHYWFGHGRMMLHEPIEWMLQDGQPDLPFCLCWANHKWYKKTWNSSKSVLDKQELLTLDYGDEADWRLHFETLLPAFQDPRYYKIDGRPVFVLYRIQDIPDVDKFKASWDQWLREFYTHHSPLTTHHSPLTTDHSPTPSGFYWMNYIDDEAKLQDSIQNSCEKKIVMLKENITSVQISNVFLRKLSRFLRMLVSSTLKIPMGVHQFPRVRKKLCSPIFADESVIPTLVPNWDNTPRRQEGATVLHNATPEQFYLHCKEVFGYLKNKDNKLVWLKSWNEWGEGNYMEPDLKYGHGYLQALKRALDEFES